MLKSLESVMSLHQQHVVTQHFPAREAIRGVFVTGVKPFANGPTLLTRRPALDSVEDWDRFATTKEKRNCIN